MDETGSFGATGGSAIANAMGWIAGVLAGPAATGLAVIAVALVGFAMLNGHVSTRRATTVLIGSFLLFGAQTLAAGFLSSVRGEAERQEIAAAPPPPPAPVRKPRPYNPYSKASMGE